MLKLQTIKSSFHIAHFNDEPVLCCFIHKTLLQARQRIRRTGYMIWNATTVTTKSRKTRKVMASFFKPHAHFPGTRDQGRDSNRVFPKYEAGVLPPIAPNYLGISRDDTLRCYVNATVAETHKHRTF
jgi:hypothetical protein